MKRDIFHKQHDLIKTFCRRNHIRRLSIFGSVLKGEATAGSDIDLLVEFHHDHVPGLLALVGMENELSNLLGKKVDLKTAQDLSKYFRDEVLDEARDAYAEER